MKKYSGHKLYKFPTGHTLRSECEYPYRPTMKGGHTHNHIRNAHFGSWPSGALIDWVCTPGAPWYMKTKMPGFKWADKIGDGLITDYFESHVIRRKDNG